MKIYPIAFDSFGVRSEAILITANGLKIIIDPGVALGPRRYGLPPTDEEYLALSLAREEIIKVCKKADIVIVTHYHYDHHPFPSDDEMYEACFQDKVVIAKNIKEGIHPSGRRRGKIFESKVKDLAKSLVWGDEKEFIFGRTKLRISPAVWHGEVGSKVGTVVMVYVSDGIDSFIHGSDAQNLADPKALEWVIKENPKHIIIDGYPTIFLGWKKSMKSFRESLKNLKKAIESIDANEAIIDHHLVRDIDYESKMVEVYEHARRLGKRIITAAQYYGMSNFFLEAWRKELSKGLREADVEEYYRELRKRIP